MIERLTFNHGVSLPQGQLRLEVKPPPAAPEAEETVRPMYRPVEASADLPFWCGAVFTALLFFRPQDHVPALAPLHLSEVAAVVGLLALLAGRVRAGLPPVAVTPELLGVAGLAILMVLTAPFSIWPGGALATLQNVYLKVALVFVLLTHSIRSPRLLRRLTWIIVLAMGCVAFQGVLNYLRGVNLLRGRLQGPVEGLMGNPNDLAMNMVTFLPFAVCFAFARGKPLPRLVAAGISVLMIATIVFTKSRSGVLGLAVVFMMLLLTSGRYRVQIGAVLLVGALVAVPLAPESMRTRVSSIFNQEEDETGSREARKELMVEAWRTFLERPLVGVGAGQFKNYNPPGRLEPFRETHNVILQVLVELGIAGGIIMVFLIVRGGMALVQTTRRLPGTKRRGWEWPASIAFRADEAEWMRTHIAALTAGLAGWVVCAQFASIGYYWTFYYALALIVAGREVARQRLAAVFSATRERGQPRPGAAA